MGVDERGVFFFLEIEILVSRFLIFILRPRLLYFFFVECAFFCVIGVPS